VGCILITGSDKAFAAGADIKEMADKTYIDIFRADYTADYERLTRVRKPVIAAVAGFALGGGCELAMFCDITIAADNAIFGEPEIHFSNVGPAIVMPWMIGFKKARELLYFGDMIDAETALQLGMINRIVPLAELQDKTLRFAKRMALISPEALTHTKLAINRGADAMGFTDAMHAGLDVVAPLYAAKTDVGVKFNEIRQKEGLRAALKWRRDQFTQYKD
jgi:enoyl-CoA hydratase/carnithine racemase